MKVLVTGATGFIGTYVINNLLSQGHEVIATSRSEVKASQCDWYSKVRYFPLTIGQNNEELYKRSDRPDALVHTAWDKLNSYRDPYHFENALMDHYFFIKGLVQAGLQQCVILGTCLEYGMQSGALHEALEAKPKLAYPLAKHLLRELLCGLQRTCEFTLQWVRLFYLYGPGQRSSSLLAQLDVALEKGQPNFDMSAGDQVRDYLPVTDVANIICSVMANRGFDGIVNCCSGKPISVRELVETHLSLREAKIELNLGKYLYPDYEPFSFWGDRTKLDSLLYPQRNRS